MKIFFNNYVISFDENLGLSYSLDLSAFPDAVESNVATNFKVFDLSNNVNVPYLFLDYGRAGKIDGSDIIYFYEKDLKCFPHESKYDYIELSLEK